MTSAADPARSRRSPRSKPETGGDRRPRSARPRREEPSERVDRANRPEGARAQADERVEARARRRFRRAAVSVFGAALLVTAGLGLSRTSLFAVQPEVTGLVHLGEDQVLDAAGISPATRFFDVNDERARQGVLALPWVEKVTVSSAAPHRVRIDVIERVPAGTAPCPGEAVGCRLVVDRSGRVLGEAGGSLQVPALEQLAAVPGTGQWLDGSDKEVAAAAGFIPDDLRPHVRSVGRDGADLVLRLTPKATAAGTANKNTAKTTTTKKTGAGTSSTPAADVTVVRLGSAEKLPEKLGAAAAVYEKGAARDVSMIDVRSPGHPTLTRTSAPSPTSTSRKG